MSGRLISRRDLIGGAAAATVALSGPGAAGGEEPAAGPRSPPTRPAPAGGRDDRSDVIVIGAGLSGLNAAMLLEEQGLKITLLEGRQRVGGRVTSVDSVPGHPEAGANAIVGNYARLRDAARRFGAELVDHMRASELNRTKILALGGEMITAAAWEKSPRNPFPENLRSTMPWEYVPRVISQTNPLSALDDWYNSRFRAYDVSLHELLVRNGATDAMIQLANDTNSIYGTSAYDVSILQMYGADLWGRFQQKTTRVSLVGKGGNQRIPEAIARNLKREVVLGKTVRAINSAADGVEVRCGDGSRYLARFAICSIPLTVLRDVKIEPVLVGVQDRAVKTVAYAPCTQVHMVASYPFWETDGLPPYMWTDSIAGFVVPNRHNESALEVTSFTAWARGFGARYLDRLGPEAAKAAVIAAIEAIRPAAKGRLRALYIKSWELDPFAGGADFMVWGPGQISAFHGDLWKPHGRMHFCGEHTAMLERGMEGAMESGERAALEVLARI